MQVLHLIRSMRREGGGPAELLRLLADAYQRNHHQMEIASLDSPQCYASGIDVPLHCLGTGGGDYGFSAELRPWLRANAKRFDAIVVDGLWQYHNYAALQEVSGRYPYAVVPHGMLDPWFKQAYPFKHLKKLPYWLTVQRRLLNRADSVIFTTPQERDLAQCTFPGGKWRSKVVPLGTLGSTGPEWKDIRAFYETVPEIRGRSFLLFAGRLDPKKGCDLLLRAYAALRDHVSLPPLVFAGPDNVGYGCFLRELAAKLGIEDRLTWAGMLVGPSRWGAFRAADAVILPSHQENFGLVVAEALSCGTAVLISDKVNLCRQVEDSGCGVVAPDTLEGTMRLLTVWAGTSVERRRSMSKLAFRCWENNFHIDSTANALVKVLTATTKRAPFKFARTSPTFS